MISLFKYRFFREIFGEVSLFLLFSFLFFPLLLTDSNAHAGDKFIFVPFLETEYRLDSNYYKSDVQEREVRVLVLKPGFKFGYQTARSRVQLDAFLNDARYHDQDSVPHDSKPSDENDFTGHNLALSAKTELFTRITTGITDTWINTRNPSETDEFANSVSVDEYTINRISPWVKYTITDRLSASLACGNIDIDYAGRWVEDSSENSATAKLYYSLSRFSTLDLEYRRWTMDYSMTSSDYTSDQYGLNIDSRFRRFGFTAGLGFHSRDFDDGALGDLDSLVWHIAVKARNLPDTSEPRPRSHFELAYAENFNNTGSGNEYYTADRITLTAGRLFMEKLDLLLTAYFQKSDYENDLLDRSDDTWFFSAALDYLAREWLILSLETGYETRDSSMGEYDYDNYYILCKINFNYNFGSR